MRSQPFLTRITLLALTVTLGGCMPIPEPLPLPKDETAMSAVLTRLILDPSPTCEELRDTFGVDNVVVVDTPDQIGLDYSEHWLPAADGTTLRVWHLPARLDRGVVIIAMGATGQIPCYLFTAQLLLDNGWSVVMFDYRGFGGSDGRPDVDSLSGDLETVLDWTLAATQREQVTLMGISLGTVPAIATAVARPEAVNGVIADSPLAIGEELVRLEFLLREQISAFLRLIRPDLLSEVVITDMHAPLIVMLAEADIVTTPQSVQLLYERAPGVKQLIRFPGVGHARAQYRDPSTYAAQLERFLAAVWGQAPVGVFSPHDSLTAVPWVQFIDELQQARLED